MLPHLTEYNPEIYPDIRQLKCILYRNEELHKSFRDKVFLKSNRQPPNLWTKAKFTSYQREQYNMEM